jgi:dynein heavy chain
MASMGHPGGGRNLICGRTQSRFSLINLTFPSDSQIIRIFDAILQSKFVEYDNEIKQLSVNIASATVNVYKMVCVEFLATPEEFHYLL